MFSVNTQQLRDLPPGISSWPETELPAGHGHHMSRQRGSNSVPLISLCVLRNDEVGSDFLVLWTSVRNCEGSHYLPSKGVGRGGSRGYFNCRGQAFGVVVRRPLPTAGQLGSTLSSTSSYGFLPIKANLGGSRWSSRTWVPATMWDT